MFKNSLQTDKNTKYAGSSELLSAESNLIRYNRDITNQIIKQTRNCIRVLEFGAGIGTLASEYKGATGIKPECVEIDTIQAELIIDRGFICYSSMDEIGAHIQYDAIYTSNVLEHIENDYDAISLLRKHLKPNGVLVIYVPAFMVLFSDLDKSVGHYRRYQKKELIGKVLKNGLTVRECYYVDCIGFLAWLYVKYRGYNSEKHIDNDKKMRVYDSFIYPVSRFFDFIGFRYLFGKNIMLVASNDNE